MNIAAVTMAARTPPEGTPTANPISRATNFCSPVRCGRLSKYSKAPPPATRTLIAEMAFEIVPGSSASITTPS